MRDAPQPCGGLAWLEFGVSRLGSGVDAVSISLGSSSACASASQSLHCDLLWGFAPLFPIVPSPSCCKTPWSEPGIFPREQNPASAWGNLGTTLHLLGLGKAELLEIPSLSSCWAFGEAGGWWAVSLEPGCSPWTVVAPGLSGPVPSGGGVT